MPTIARTTDHELTWKRAREWITWCTRASGGQSTDFCKQVHTSCEVILTDRRLPTRLVYVPEVNDDDIRLCIVKDIPRSNGRLKYATLTHCWRKKPMPITTTRDNLEEMLRHIPFQQLSKTFQDAIIITRQLGYRYLWIGSLCILQGDVDDWANESAIMGAIYAGCTINIVADAPKALISYTAIAGGGGHPLTRPLVIISLLIHRRNLHLRAPIPMRPQHRPQIPLISILTKEFGLQVLREGLAGAAPSLSLAEQLPRCPVRELDVGVEICGAKIEAVEGVGTVGAEGWAIVPVREDVV